MTDGFVRVPNWILDDSDLNLHELVVYTVLLRFRDRKTGKCRPGMTTIADRARISTRTARRAIEQLEARGIIQVERRSTIRDNVPNVYTVSIASETPERIWESTARGKRIPKRSQPEDSESLPPEDSESPGAEVGNEPEDSESPAKDSESQPEDSESLPPRTPSPPNKIHTRSKNKTHGQAVTSAQEREPQQGFTFDVVEERASPKQVALLKDLWIHATGFVFDEELVDKWERLTLDRARDVIQSMYGACGRYDEYVGPERGTPAYAALSPQGRRWADAKLIPADYLEAAS